ncbi:MAG: hypothetical protein CHACPFDD_00950 [Phycisphaerae bacterium]|nr:hypothetical protein [Phycisphaerae bacterium]
MADIPVAPKPPRPPPDPLDATARQNAADTNSQLDPATEKDLWQGRASWKSLYPLLALWLVLVLAAIILLGLYSSGRAALYALYVGLILLAPLLVVGVLRVWGLSYKLTTQRLFIRRGILTQTVDQTELMRVDDVKIRQTLLERVLRIGLVEVSSSDRTDAKLSIRHIDDPETVAEHVRRHTRTVQRRTVFMEQL